MKHNKHVLITGLVRTGTTFLVAYYHMLGFNTGYERRASGRIMDKNHKTHGGMELLNDLHPLKNTRRLKETEVIKHPWNVDGKYPPWVKIMDLDLEFDHIILTQREHNKYSQSVADCWIRRGKITEKGRLRQEEKALRAAPIKMQQLEEWIDSTKANIIKINFPQNVYDFEYLWNKLEPTMKSIKKDRAYKIWLALRNPDYINFK